MKLFCMVSSLFPFVFISVLSPCVLLARNMTFLIKSIALGKEKWGVPKQEEWIPTNFIR